VQLRPGFAKFARAANAIEIKYYTSCAHKISIHVVGEGREGMSRTVPTASASELLPPTSLVV
jgi:hypothetical protein